MVTQNNILKWAKQLNCKIPFLHPQINRAACLKLASNKTAQAVPFLISALANNDEDIRCTAENALDSLNSPEAIDALRLGYVFTGDDSLRRILTSLGQKVPENPALPASQSHGSVDSFPLSEQVWKFQNNKDGTTLAFIPEGDFLAGKESFPIHLPPYYLAFACVTNTQYARFLTEIKPNSTKLVSWINLKRPNAEIHQVNDIYEADTAKAEFPVIWVTWEGAVAYCKWAHMRLPTELEWEKGARGVDGNLYPWGDEWEAGRPQPPEGERKPEEIMSAWAYPTARSPYGLYQMIGNVYEWCAESYEQGAYQRYAQGNLRPPPHREHKVLRGGPWCFGAPAHLRTEYRKSTVWRAGTALCGFRCAKSL